MAKMDNPGLASETPFKYPNVTRKDLTTNTVSVNVKDGLTVVNRVSKADVKGGKRGNPPGGFRKSNSSEPAK